MSQSWNNKNKSCHEEKEKYIRNEDEHSRETFPCAKHSRMQRDRGQQPQGHEWVSYFRNLIVLPNVIPNSISVEIKIFTKVTYSQYPH